MASSKHQCVSTVGLKGVSFDSQPFANSEAVNFGDPPDRLYQYESNPSGRNSCPFNVNQCTEREVSGRYQNHLPQLIPGYYQINRHGTPADALGGTVYNRAFVIHDSCAQRMLATTRHVPDAGIPISGGFRPTYNSAQGYSPVPPSPYPFPRRSDTFTTQLAGLRMVDSTNTGVCMATRYNQTNQYVESGVPYEYTRTPRDREYCYQTPDMEANALMKRTLRPSSELPRGFLQYQEYISRKYDSGLVLYCCEVRRLKLSVFTISKRPYRNEQVVNVSKITCLWSTWWHCLLSS